MKSLFALCLFLILQGCVVAHEAPSRKGPPDHAPAHGYRAKYRYNYYPEVRVYFDLDRNIYFYLDPDWRSSRELPKKYGRLGRPVFLELEQDKPYKHHKEHYKKYHHPSGKEKKFKNKNKRK